MDDVPVNSNIITCNVLYKVEDLDDEILKMKARITLHGNKDQGKEELKTDCVSCPPFGLRTLVSIAVLLQFFITEEDIKSAFLQSGEAQREVYVILP